MILSHSDRFGETAACRPPRAEMTDARAQEDRLSPTTHLGVDPSGDPQRADRRGGLSVPSSRCLLQTRLWHQRRTASPWARRTGKTSHSRNRRRLRGAAIRPIRVSSHPRLAPCVERGAGLRRESQADSRGVVGRADEHPAGRLITTAACRGDPAARRAASRCSDFVPNGQPRTRGDRACYLRGMQQRGGFASGHTLGSDSCHWRTEGEISEKGAAVTFIETVPESQATGRAADIYRQDREVYGELPNFTKAFSQRPDVYAAWRAERSDQGEHGSASVRASHAGCGAPPPLELLHAGSRIGSNGQVPRAGHRASVGG